MNFTTKLAKHLLKGDSVLTPASLTNPAIVIGTVDRTTYRERGPDGDIIFIYFREHPETRRPYPPEAMVPVVDWGE